MNFVLSNIWYLSCRCPNLEWRQSDSSSSRQLRSLPGLYQSLSWPCSRCRWAVGLPYGCLRRRCTQGRMTFWTRGRSKGYPTGRKRRHVEHSAHRWRCHCGGSPSSSSSQRTLRMLHRWSSSWESWLQLSSFCIGRRFILWSWRGKEHTFRWPSGRSPPNIHGRMTSRRHSPRSNSYTAWDTVVIAMQHLCRIWAWDGTRWPGWMRQCSKIHKLPDLW